MVPSLTCANAWKKLKEEKANAGQFILNYHYKHSETIMVQNPHAMVSLFASHALVSSLIHMCAHLLCV